jgi:1,4-dihydroxy-2-naphthoate octaprenyltransferase
LAALLGALLLQVGSNFANDVFDFEKGADTEERQGPARAVASGWIAPLAMKRAMWGVFVAASLVGVYLTVIAGPAIVALGLLSITAALAYTAGPYPLGYHGLGEVFVILFFGFAAVCGTAFVNSGQVGALAVWASVPVGALASSILVVNNVRDEQTDRRCGKRTLVVRWGRNAGVVEYGLLLAAAYGVPLVLALSGAGPAPLLPWVTLPWAVSLWRTLGRERGPGLNRTLAATAQLLLAFSVLFSVGLAWSCAR